MYMFKLIVTKSQEEMLRISVKLHVLLDFVFHNLKKTTSSEILGSRMATMAQNGKFLIVIYIAICIHATI